MVDSRTVAVVVPAYDEEQLYPGRLRASPSSSTASTSSTARPCDGTAEKAEVDSRVHLIRHEESAAASRRHRPELPAGDRRSQLDVTCVMAADNQMAPDDLEAIALRRQRRRGLREGEPARQRRGVAADPRPRYLGNALLSLLTKSRPATGTSPTRSPASRRIARHARDAHLDLVCPRYGPERHARSPQRRRRRCAAFLAPVYNVGEQSGFAPRVIPAISWLLLKRSSGGSASTWSETSTRRVLLCVPGRDVHRRTGASIARCRAQDPR